MTKNLIDFELLKLNFDIELLFSKKQKQKAKENKRKIFLRQISFPCMFPGLTAPPPPPPSSYAIAFKSRCQRRSSSVNAKYTAVSYI